MREQRLAFHRRTGKTGATADNKDEETVLEIDARELSGLFAAPAWMRDLGFSAWLLVGVAAALAGGIWLLSLTQTIVMPVLTAGIIASVAGPAVTWLSDKGLPRALGAALVFVLIVLIGIGLGLLVLGGITSQAAVLTQKLQAGATEIEAWVKSLGINPQSANDAKESASSSASGALKALTSGVVTSVEVLAGLAIFLSFTALSLFFLLKDGPQIAAFAERHLGVPVPVAHTILDRAAGSLRGYFVGVSIVSAWSSLLVGVGALVLGVPLAGTIVAVTFVGGFIPYLGAWTAGAFAVLIALGDSSSAALAMAVIVLLANGVLQQLVQPIAYGAALSLHPLAVLIVTIAGGCLFGTVGLVLAAPMLSAAVKITADLKKATTAEEAADADAAPDAGPPGDLAEPAPA